MVIQSQYHTTFSFMYIRLATPSRRNITGYTSDLDSHRRPLTSKTSSSVTPSSTFTPSTSYGSYLSPQIQPSNR